MAKSTKSYEERMLEMEKKEQESLEKAKRYAAQKKELLKRKKAEESKKRTHRLCQVGGAVESVLGAPIEEEDIPKLIGFLKRQEANGKFFSKAMHKKQDPYGGVYGEWDQVFISFLVLSSRGPLHATTTDSSFIVVTSPIGFTQCCGCFVWVF